MKRRPTFVAELIDALKGPGGRKGDASGGQAMDVLVTGATGFVGANLAWRADRKAAAADYSEPNGAWPRRGSYL